MFSSSENQSRGSFSSRNGFMGVVSYWHKIQACPGKCLQPWQQQCTRADWPGVHWEEAGSGALTATLPQGTGIPGSEEALYSLPQLPDAGCSPPLCLAIARREHCTVVASRVCLPAGQERWKISRRPGDVPPWEKQECTGSPLCAFLFWNKTGILPGSPRQWEVCLTSKRSRAES